MAVAPDIISRPQIPLSATTDQPILDAPRPPESASNDPVDLAGGTPKEITATELAVAAQQRAGALEPATEEGVEGEGQGEGDKPAAKPLKVDATEPDPDGEVDGKLPRWAQREIREERRKAREYRTAVEAAAKTAVGSAEWEKAINLGRDQLLHKEREAAKTAGKEAREAREAAEVLRTELEELKAKGAPAAEDKPAEDARPARHDFDDPDAYDEALTEWGKREGLRAAEAETVRKAAEAKGAEDARIAAEQQQEHEAEVTRVNTAWTAQREAAIEKYPDYVEVAEATPDDGGPTITQVMAVSIMQADNGADVAYYLGQNTEESERIAAIKNPAKQIMEMGRLVERLANPTRRVARPKPIEPVDTNNSPQTDTGEEPDMDTYFKNRTTAMRKDSRPFFPPSQIH